MFGFEPPIIAKEKIECVEYGASLAIKIKECVGADGYSIENFLPKAQIDAKEGWKKIVSETKSIRKGLSRVVCSVLAEDKTKFLSLPLNPTGAFSRQSGILEATVKLMEVAKTVASQQNLDSDLMVAASILYYNGVIDTIDDGYNYTVADLMYGPSICSYTKVQKKAMELMQNEEARQGISGEDVMLLAHTIAVKGDEVEPVIPEATALKLLHSVLVETDDMNEMLKKGDTQIVTDVNNIHKRSYFSPVLKGENNVFCLGYYILQGDILLHPVPAVI